MQALGTGNAFDGGHGPALDLDAEDQTGVDQSAIEEHIAGAAVAVVATLLGAGQAQLIAQHFEEALPGFAQELCVLAVDLGQHMDFSGHDQFSFARARALPRARFVSTPTRCRRYAASPRMSLIGLAAACARVAALSMAASVKGPSTRAAPASGTSRGVGATAARATRAATQR